MPLSPIGFVEALDAKAAEAAAMRAFQSQRRAAQAACGAGARLGNGPGLPPLRVVVALVVCFAADYLNSLSEGIDDQASSGTELRNEL